MESLHLLKEWIVANTSQAQFAREVGISESFLSEILNRKKQSSMPLAAKMSRATGGAVPLDAFVVEAAE